MQPDSDETKQNIRRMQVRIAKIKKDRAERERIQIAETSTLDVKGPAEVVRYWNEHTTEDTSVSQQQAVAARALLAKIHNTDVTPMPRTKKKGSR